MYWHVIGITYHCFREYDRGGFLSLCGQYQVPRAGSRRAPPSYLRCGKCDDIIRGKVPVPRTRAARPGDER